MKLLYRTPLFIKFSSRQRRLNCYIHHSYRHFNFYGIRSIDQVTRFDNDFYLKSCINLFNHSSIFFGSTAYNLLQNRKPKLVVMKLESQIFRNIFTPELEKLIGLFEKYGYELRIAGGAVRDILMEKIPDDIDFATTATPLEMKELFNREKIRMLNTNGEKHGTITCRIDDKANFEITTLRIDVSTDGRHAKVQFTRDWELDALRRDLTINSMFIGFDGTLYDYFKGREDLEDHKIVFVGSADERIQEDYLRILRYFRFFGRISEDPDCHNSETLLAIKRNAEGLAQISRERIWVEVKKILTGPHAGSVFRMMLSLGLGQYIGLPKPLDIENFCSVYENINDLDPSPMTLLTALLQNEEQITHLRTHIKMSNDELRLGSFILAHRDDDHNGDVNRWCRDLYCDTIGKDNKNIIRIMELMKYLNQRSALEFMKTWEPTKFPVKGTRLLEEGIEKGPNLAEVLKQMRHIWKKSDYQANEKDLMEFLPEIKRKIFS